MDSQVQKIADELAFYFLRKFLIQMEKRDEIKTGEREKTETGILRDLGVKKLPS